MKIEPKSSLNKPDQLLQMVSDALSMRVDESIDAAFPVGYAKDPYRVALEILAAAAVIGLGLWIAGVDSESAYFVAYAAALPLVLLYKILQATEVGVVAVTPTRYLLLRSKAGVPQAEVATELPRSFPLPQPHTVGHHGRVISGPPIPFPGFEGRSKSWRYVGSRTDRDDALYQHLRRLANEAEPAGIVGSESALMIKRMRIALGPDVGRVTAVYPLKPPMKWSMAHFIFVAGALTIMLMSALEAPMWIRLGGIGLLVIGTILAMRMANPLKRQALVLAGESALLVRHDDALSQAEVTGQGSRPADLDAFLQGHKLELDGSFSWVATEAAAR